MRLAIALIATSIFLPASLPADDFDWMTREFVRESHARQIHIPFLGLARFVVTVGHPVGTSELRLAIFEKMQAPAGDFPRLADETVGHAWKPIVRVRSRNGEFTNIYVQEEGKHLRVFIATLDKEEAVFVRVRIRPDKLIEFVDQQRRDHHA